MGLFCYNECFTASAKSPDLISSLSNVLEKYSELKKKHPQLVDGIVTPKSPLDTKMNDDGLFLAKCFDYLDPELYRFALTTFTKYDIEVFLPVPDEVIDELVENEHYCLDEGNNRIDGLNARIINLHGGLLFSLPVQKFLRNNTIKFYSNDNENEAAFENHNFYGTKENTDYIEKLLLNKQLDGVNGFQKIEVMFPRMYKTNRFRRDFENLSAAMQDSIIERLKSAIDRGGASKLYSDGEIIKNVSSEKATYGVCELRIFEPVALRLYFYELNEDVFFASIEKKPNKAKQSNHIRAAEDSIKELILTKDSA